ncbi:MAG: hypothetical protein KAH10_06560 [Flavobacteriales bacterium]|nr:hypothetical protein [Flavobacteriales bacterium]
MGLLEKFDFRVLLFLAVLTIGVDYFNDPTFGQKDIIIGLVSAVIGTFVWGVMKEKLGFK